MSQSSDIKKVKSVKKDRLVGWQKRLILRALFATTLASVLKTPGLNGITHLLILTGISKQTLYNAFEDPLKVHSNIFKDKCFMQVLCSFIDLRLERDPNFKESYLKNLQELLTNRDSNVCKFLSSEGVEENFIQDFCTNLNPTSHLGYVPIGVDRILTSTANLFYRANQGLFENLWLTSFNDLNNFIEFDLKGQQTLIPLFKVNFLKEEFKPVTYDLTKIKEAFMTFEFLSHLDLKVDVFFYPILKYLINNKASLIFDLSTLESLHNEIADTWDETLAQDERQKLLFLSESNNYEKIAFLRNLGILATFKLLGRLKKLEVDILLEAKIESPDYKKQALLLLTELNLSLRKKYARTKLSLNTCKQFLNSLGNTRTKHFYLFDLAFSEQNPSLKQSGLLKLILELNLPHNSLHLFTLATAPFRDKVLQRAFRTLEVTSFEGFHYPLFNNLLNTIYIEDPKDCKFVIDNKSGGKALIAKLQDLDEIIKTLKKVPYFEYFENVKNKAQNFKTQETYAFYHGAKQKQA